MATAYQWIVDHIGYDADDCLQWPFYRSPQGRGMLGVKGKSTHASRLMCTLAHGEPPTPQHQAAHSCGNGHLACMNPKHLSWKTGSENRRDCAEHGTSGRHNAGASGKLDYSKATEIRTLQGKETAFVVAERYGVHPNTIYFIWQGKTVRSPAPLKNPSWRPDEDERLRRLTARGVPDEEIASVLGRPKQGLVRRRRILGIEGDTPMTASRNELADRFERAPIWADDDDPAGFCAVDTSPAERDLIVAALRQAEVSPSPRAPSAEAIARLLCDRRGYNPDALEPGDVYGIDGHCSNGDPAHFKWRHFAGDADAILALFARSVAESEK